MNWIKVTENTLPIPGIYVGWDAIQEKEIIAEFSMYNPNEDDEGNADEGEKLPYWMDAENLAKHVDITHYRQIFFNIKPV